MFTQSVGAEHKSLYASPLAEEIVISFEECILSRNTTKSYLEDRIGGTAGSAGAPENGSDFDGGSIDL
jgi:hypothetical protein